MILCTVQNRLAIYNSGTSYTRVYFTGIVGLIIYAESFRVFATSVLQHMDDWQSLADCNCPENSSV